MQQQTQAVPDGYMRNTLGHLVPKDQVREQDLLRDEVVRKIVTRAVAINAQLKAFKAATLRDIADLITIAGERYDVELGGKKGNITLTTYDGRYKVQRSVADRIIFTEEIEAGRALITKCIDRWSEGANANIRALVDRAFRTDKQGQIKTAAVLDLLRLEIDDAEWQNAMQAIKDSIQATGATTYVRVYERVGDSDAYKPIVLDLAGV